MVPSGKGVTVGLVVMVGVRIAGIVGDKVMLGVMVGGSIVIAIVVVVVDLLSLPHPTNARRIKINAYTPFLIWLLQEAQLRNPVYIF
jgi:hypothetical protein